MFCNQCGHHNPLEANFCSSCGSPLERPEGGEDPTITFMPVVASGEVADDPLAISLDGVPENTGVLLVKRGETTDLRFVLEHDHTSAGRHPESDIFLDDITVSRRHVDIQNSDGDYRIVDLGSLNGTYVNRERIDTIPLRSGDEIQIGKFKMVFLGGRSAEDGGGGAG